MSGNIALQHLDYVFIQRLAPVHVITRIRATATHAVIGQTALARMSLVWNRRMRWTRQRVDLRVEHIASALMTKKQWIFDERNRPVSYSDGFFCFGYPTAPLGVTR
jgi:hypothetical protein